MDAKVRSRGGTLAVAGLDDTPHDKNETCGVEAGESMDMGVYIASVWLGRWFSPRLRWQRRQPESEPGELVSRC